MFLIEQEMALPEPSQFVARVEAFYIALLEPRGNVRVEWVNDLAHLLEAAKAGTLWAQCS